MYPNIIFKNPEDKALIHLDDLKEAYKRCDSIANSTVNTKRATFKQTNAFNRLHRTLKLIPAKFHGVAYESLAKAMYKYTADSYTPTFSEDTDPLKQLSARYAKFIKEELLGE